MNSGGTLCGFLQHLTHTQSSVLQTQEIRLSSLFERGFFIRSGFKYTNCWDSSIRALWDILSCSRAQLWSFTVPPQHPLMRLKLILAGYFQTKCQIYTLKSRQFQTKKLDASYDKLNHENLGLCQKKACPIYSVDRHKHTFTLIQSKCTHIFMHACKNHTHLSRIWRQHHCRLCV